jgi:teichuronic acid biosynthesis glycosyltransferase TuaH
VTPDETNGTFTREIVVCSLEPWDEVWRRNQFFTDALLRRNQDLRVLFVEPPADPLHELRERRAPVSPRLRKVFADRRLLAFRPLKVLPRRLGPVADGALRAQVRAAVRVVGFSSPTLWVNDVTYAPLIVETGWPALYDITDDWLVLPSPSRELQRLRRLDELALRMADEVVVCSEALAESRGRDREVVVVPNAVDVEHFRRPRQRPADLPQSPVAVYIGTLHDARLDVELVTKLATALPQLSVVLVGPDSLGEHSHRLLGRLPNVKLLGSRPYRDVPAYLQHADVIVVPHRVSPFTESLDPIKAYECLAVGVATVATPVSGFRDLGEPVTVAPRESFVDAVASALARKPVGVSSRTPASWGERAREFERVLARAHLGA